MVGCCPTLPHFYFHERPFGEDGTDHLADHRESNGFSSSFGTGCNQREPSATCQWWKVFQLFDSTFPAKSFKALHLPDHFGFPTEYSGHQLSTLIHNLWQKRCVLMMNETKLVLKRPSIYKKNDLCFCQFLILPGPLSSVGRWATTRSQLGQLILV